MCIACDGALSGYGDYWMGLRPSREQLREALLTDLTSSPQSQEEYLARFNANQRVSGYGIEGVTMHSPCPFCAAPDWAAWPVIDTEQAMQQEQTCQECGRSGRFVFLVNEPGRKEFEFVQTGGDDAPSWLMPAPRRVDPAAP